MCINVVKDRTNKTSEEFHSIVSEKCQKEIALLLEYLNVT